MSADNEWIQVGDLAEGISENLLPPSNELAGKTITLYLEDGSVCRYSFQDNQHLKWQDITEQTGGAGDSELYRATSLRNGIYFLDYIKQSEQATSVTIVLDFNSNAATYLEGRLPTLEESRKDLFSRVNEGISLTGVKARFLAGSINQDFSPDTKRHPVTSELVGKRVRYVYSKTEAYEHIYLNDKLYTWHCLSGIEKGLADTDRCHYYKIEENLYFFVWREKIIPTLGVVLIDTDQMKTTGKLFGYESNDFGKLTNAAIGAYADLLNITSYE